MLKEWLVYIFVGLVMLGLVVVYVLEFVWFNCILDMLSLVFYSMGFGGCIGFVLGYYVVWYENGLIEKI